MGSFVFRSAAGLIVEGATFRSVEFAPRALGIGTVLSWNDIKPAGMAAMTAAEIRSAMRRWFAWDDFVERVARVIACYDGDQLAAIRETTALALADVWPATIVNGGAFIANCDRRGLTASTVSLGGLLGLLLDALRDPWDSPSEPLPDADRAQRLARLVMLASADPELVQPGPSGTQSVEAGDDYATQRILLLSARLGENDHLQPFLVRTYEIYVTVRPEMG